MKINIIVLLIKNKPNKIMATEIKEINGMFQIVGSITSANCHAIKSHLESTLVTGKDLLLSIEKVISIDASGAFILEALYKKAGLENLVISIFGLENDDIQEVMSTTKTRYILSNDRV
ncbi:hypothetical protein BFP77_11500 [Maribacter sp. 4U21]|nr:hypothetical protein BFP77_11500 [Maribacter sp. 4U21]